MGSIDLYNDFNDELDARAGDSDGEGNSGAEGGGDNSGSDKDNDQDGQNKPVDAKIKIVKVKRKLVTLNVERLKGPRGIIAVDDFFKDIRFKGKGHEKQDLNEVMKRLEHWAHR